MNYAISIQQTNLTYNIKRMLIDKLTPYRTGRCCWMESTSEMFHPRLVVKALNRSLSVRVHYQQPMCARIDQAQRMHVSLGKQNIGKWPNRSVERSTSGV